MLALACAEPEVVPVPPDASCAVDDNGLRGVCVVDLARPARARVGLTLPGDAEVRWLLSSTVARRHELPFWGIPPDADVTFLAVDESTGLEDVGGFRTGPLPPAFDNLGLEVDPGPDSAIDALLLASRCPSGHVWMMDRRGRVVWWERVGDAERASVDAVSFTDDRTVLVLLDREQVVEVELDGRRRLTLTRGRDFQDFVHHDVTRGRGLVWVPHSDAVVVDGTTWVADGVYAFDDQRRLVMDLPIADLFPREWAPWMASGYWLGPFPDALDPVHVNGVDVDPDGRLAVSMRHLSAIGVFDADPDSAGFGELQELVVGDPGSPVIALADRTAKPAFSGQHDAHLADDGTWWLFDNRMRLGGTARAVQAAPDGAVLRELASFDTDDFCPVRGGARELTDGHVVTTCYETGRMREFAPGSQRPVWEATVSCGGEAEGSVVRAWPVQR